MKVKSSEPPRTTDARKIFFVQLTLAQADQVKLARFLFTFSQSFRGSCLASHFYAWNFTILLPVTFHFFFFSFRLSAEKFSAITEQNSFFPR
jgi:hypothetical protein